MSPRQPRYSKEEHERLGSTLYEKVVRPQVEAGNLGKVVALDVDSGGFEVADNTLDACRQLLARSPDSQIWCVRVGHRGVYRFGSQFPRINA